MVTPLAPILEVGCLHEKAAKDLRQAAKDLKAMGFETLLSTDSVQVGCEHRPAVLRVRDSQNNHYRSKGPYDRVTLPDLLLALATCERRADSSRPCGARYTDLAVAGR